jgi:hypothetical protein
MMELRGLLAEKKIQILKRWFDLILEAYPPEVARFFREEKDRFANPAGYALSLGMENLFNELTCETDSGAVVSILDGVIRIQAVQDISPLQALTFVFLLKKAVREELEETIERGPLFKDYLSFESRIDAMSLVAFEVYMKCREEISRIRIREMTAEKDRVLRVLEMMNRKQDA